MRQAFKAKNETYGRYVMPEASWETRAVTDTLLVQWPTNTRPKGKLYVRYRFFLQGQDTGDHEIRLTIEQVD